MGTPCESATASSRITSPEKEVILEIVRGISNKYIAAELRISPGTVRRHVENIYARVGISKRTDLVLYAMKYGLIDESIIASASAQM